MMESSFREDHRVYTLMNSQGLPLSQINMRTNSECGGHSVNAENGYHTLQWVTPPWRGGTSQGGWGWWWWWWWGSLPGSQSSIISHPHSTGTRLLLSCLHIPGMTVEWVMSKSMSRDSWWRPGWHYVPIWWISGAGKLHLSNCALHSALQFIAFTLISVFRD